MLADYSGYSDGSAAGAIVGVVVALFELLFAAAAYVATGWGLSRLFAKLGVEPWRGWVPFLNAAEVMRLGGFNPLFVLFVLIPGMGPIFVAVLVWVSAHRLGQRLGLGVGHTVLAVFLFPVWALLVGFGGARPRPGSGEGDLGARIGFGAPQSPGFPAPAGYAPAAPVPSFGASAAPPAVSAAPLPPPPSIGGVPPLQPGPPARWTPPPFASSPQAAAPAPGAAVAPSAPAPVVTRAAQTPAASVPAPVPAVAQRRSAPAAPVVDPVPAPAAPVVAPTPAQVLAPVASVIESAPPSVSTGSAAVAPEADPWAPRVSVPPTEPVPVSAPADLGDQDRTVLSERRAGTGWAIVPEGGDLIPLPAAVVVLGRRPSAPASHPGALPVVVPDPSRTVSKSHAVLSLVGDTWTVHDLDSTNGVSLIGPQGEETELAPGASAPVTADLRLGDLPVSLTRVR